MRKILSWLLWALLAGALPLISVAQTWNFRAGFGQPGTSFGYADEGRAICTDAAGNVYITGWFNDDLQGNTVSFGGTPLISAEDDDGFVAKFNADGVFQWSVRFGGDFIDQGRAIATDGIAVYVVGHGYGSITVGTLSTSYDAPGGNVLTNNDGVIIKLNASTGAVQWVTRFGGPQNDEAQAVCLDNAGNIYVSGIFSTNTANPIAQFGPFQRTVQGNASNYSSDLFVAKLNSNGVFQWVSTGGIEGSNDNINGSGICYVPGTDQVVVVGSMRTRLNGSANAVYSTATPASAVLLTNSGTVVNEDFVLLELSASTGAFERGFSAGSADGNELGMAVTYDPYSQAVYFAGSFSSASVTFPGMPALVNTSPGRDNVMYGRYNPTSDSFGWVREADNGVTSTATDRAMAIAANGHGRILIAGRYNNTITFPGGLSLSASGNTDLFVARVNVINGEADYVTQGSGNHAQATDVAYGIAAAPNGKCWITGVYAGNMIFPGLSPLPSSGNSEDILLAAFADAPTIQAQPQPVTGCAGDAAVFGVLAGGSNLSFSWQEATNASFQTGVTTLSNTGVYSGTNTSQLSIADNTGLNGRYYRAVITNAGGTMRTTPVMLSTQNSTMASNSVVQQNVTNQYTFYSANCAIVAKVTPLGASPVTGNVTARVWVEPGVPEVNDIPFGQRHYEIVPANNASQATARVTLYFTQQEFDNFNAHPNSILDLPTGPGDVVGISNLRIGKHSGTSSDGSGMPLTYGASEVLDPADADIIYNTTYNRWEVTFDVTGFSGFFVQTAAAPLPVNLIAFSARWQNNDVRLNWKTAGEIEHSHFEVERSLNGNQFISIGQVPGKNSAGIEQYAFTDANAATAGHKLYYRLKMVSTSGKIEYSKVVVVIGNNPATLVTAIMPNPFTDAISFGVQAPQRGRLHVTITDMTGRKLVQRAMQVEKGFSTQTVDNLAHLRKGVYTLTVMSGGVVSTHKVIK